MRSFSWFVLLAFSLPFVVSVDSVSAQEYWEYDELDQEWERHDPVAGLKYSYGNGVEVEEQAYEWEQGEGYHEEEWYDPSDWFDSDDSVDYESNYNWGYGNDYGYDDNYYEDDYYEQGYYEDDLYSDDYYEDDYFDYGSEMGAYDPYDYDYDHYYYDESYYEDGYDYDYNNGETNGLNEDSDDGVDYTFNQQFRGEAVSLQRMRTTRGVPQTLRMLVKTEDGQERYVTLGDRTYADRYLPRFSKGDQVVIGGRRVMVDGKNMFQAKEIRSGAASYQVPQYQYEQRIEGEILGLRRVKLDNGQVEAVVARVQPENGSAMNVLLGPTSAFQESGSSIRRGSKVRIEGYKRQVGDTSTFVVQDVTVNESENERTAENPGQRETSQR